MRSSAKAVAAAALLALMSCEAAADQESGAPNVTEQQPRGSERGKSDSGSGDAHTTDISGPFDFSAIGFTDDCNPNPAFRRLLGIFGSHGENFDAGLYNSVSGETDQRLDLDEPVVWHGLNLVGVRLYSGIERGPVNYYMNFRNSPEEVLAALNAQGMNLPAVDETRDMPGLEGYAFIGVRSHPESNGNNASLVCFRD